jgi:hypothetical protein
METKLKKLGYTQEGNIFIKPLGEFRITVFPTKTGLIRRITQNGNVIEVKKVTIDTLETDKSIEEIVKYMPSAFLKNPNIVEEDIDLIIHKYPKKTESGEII